MRTFGIVQPVVLLLRIEVRARGGESWRLAFCHLVNVEGVLAGRQVFQVEPDLNSALLLGKRRGADALSFRIL
jgi:hypothetical protein